MYAVPRFVWSVFVTSVCERSKSNDAVRKEPTLAIHGQVQVPDVSVLAKDLT